jgi:hypothetical protein
MLAALMPGAGCSLGGSADDARVGVRRVDGVLTVTFDTGCAATYLGLSAVDPATNVPAEPLIWSIGSAVKGPSPLHSVVVGEPPEGFEEIVDNSATTAVPAVVLLVLKTPTRYTARFETSSLADAAVHEYSLEPSMNELVPVRGGSC